MNLIINSEMTSGQHAEMEGRSKKEYSMTKPVFPSETLQEDSY
jgi:hypothetical protein